MYIRSFNKYGQQFDKNKSERRIFVGKWGELDHYKLCFGDYHDKTLGYQFRFRISGDDSVVPLNTLDAVGIDFKDYNDKDCAWLSKYGDYVKTTSYWSKASWFVVEKVNEEEYKLHIEKRENSYLRFGNSEKGEIKEYDLAKERKNVRDTSIKYINPTASKENGDVFSFLKIII